MIQKNANLCENFPEIGFLLLKIGTNRESSDFSKINDVA